MEEEHVLVAHYSEGYTEFWHEESSPYDVRRRIPADLWQRYQRATDVLQAAQEAERVISDEIQNAGEEVPAECRHGIKSYSWSPERGAKAHCLSCQETFPWTDPCPHPFCVQDVCGVCGVTLPHVIVPFVGGPKDGEATHFHGEWNPYHCQVLLTVDSLNYVLRNRGGLCYVFVEQG